MSRPADLLLDLLFPPRCTFCRKFLARDESKICNACRPILPLAKERKESNSAIEDFISVFSYEGLVRDSLLRFKFSGMEQYAVCYGELLSAVIQTKLNIDEIDAVTWVPTSWRRTRKRGYDQSRILAKEVAKHLRKPLIRTLFKNYHNNAQSTMRDASRRRANVIGVYTAINVRKIQGKCFLMIDDILTTGATANEAARIICSAGAVQVHCAVVAS